MLLFWCSLVVLIGGIVFFTYSYKSNKNGIGIAIGTILLSLSMVLVTGVQYLNRNNEANSIVEEHTELMTSIACCSLTDVYILYDKAIELDDLVSLHRKRLNSVWVGKVFSEEVANLEYITPVLKDRITELYSNKNYFD